MGFDLSGLNPTDVKTKCDWCEGSGQRTLSEGNDPSPCSRCEGTGQIRAGEYFRNNCWWWRPLWAFVVEHNPDVITVEQANGGGFNDGVEITAEQCVKIVAKLKALLADGTVLQHDLNHNAHTKTEPDVPCEHCHGTGVRNDEYVQGECNSCHGTGMVRPWVAHYPFSEANVREFVEFAENCGGFQIY